MTSWRTLSPLFFLEIPFVVRHVVGVYFCGGKVRMGTCRSWEFKILDLVIGLSHTKPEAGVCLQGNPCDISRIAQEFPVLGIIFQFFCEQLVRAVFWLQALSRMHWIFPTSLTGCHFGSRTSSVPFHNRSIGRESMRAECMIFVYFCLLLVVFNDISVVSYY